MAPVLDMRPLPTEQESSLAEDGAQTLSKVIGKEEEVPVKVDNTQMVIPLAALRALLEVLVYMAEGKAFVVLPIEAQLTTQQAADILNVSRPHLVKLLTEGKIKYTKTKSHRRIQCKDLLEYKAALDAGRSKALDDLARESQEMGLPFE